MFHRKKIVFFLRSFEQLVQNQSVWRNHGYRALYFLKRNTNFNLRFQYLGNKKNQYPSVPSTPLSSTQGPHLFSTKNSSVQHKPQFNTKNPSFQHKNWQKTELCVKLRDFRGWKIVALLCSTDVLNWRGCGTEEDPSLENLYSFLVWYRDK